MKNRFVLAALLAATFNLGAIAADPARVSGPGFSPADESRAMLDLIEGKASAASVTTSTYDAVMAARELAWTERQALLKVPTTLQRHAMAGKDSAALVTIGEPSPEVRSLLAKSR
jgi:hypothetical protein